ncbi:MAG TPA: tetratricopeptide repeat protein [Bryobacteraceae bacterium]|nr:tetratricopeptide repeat protein [Bryobacteraceae bacterium]
MRITLYLIVAAAIGLSCVWAQKGGSTGGSAGGGGGATGGSAGGGTSAPAGPAGPSSGGAGAGTSGGGRGAGTATSPVFTNPQQNQTPTPQIQRPIFISGSVSTDDGSPIPGSLNIQAVCGADRRIVTHTSGHGDFGFQWGDTFGIFQDASQNNSMNSAFSAGPNAGPSAGPMSTSGGLGNPMLNCELQVDVSGYVSSRVPLFNYDQTERIDVGTLTIHRITGEEGTTVSVLSMKAPKKAKKDFQKGTDQFRQRKYKEAEVSFGKAVAEYPQYADAWVSLGRTERQLGSEDKAAQDFQKAMDLDKKLLGPWQELGYMASDHSKWEEAARYLDQATKLDPMDSAMMWYFSAVADFNLQRYEAAERSIRSEIRLDQDKNPRAKFLLGLILIARNDLTGGADALRAFLKVAPAGRDAEIAKQQLTRAESLASK